MQLTSMITR